MVLLFLLTIPTLSADAAGGMIGPGTGASLSLNFQAPGGNGPEDYGMAIQLMVFMTLLTLAPSIVMLTTSFMRIVIVLGFVRTAMGTQQVPSNQIIVGLALFLTFFLMSPVLDKIYMEAVVPYREKTIPSTEALQRASGHMKSFMLRQTRAHDIEFLLELAHMGPTQPKDLPIRVVVPAFVLSELRTAFQMGFMVFVPFLVIDFLVASTLMAMGMMMMPPVMIAMPLKLLLFVLVDGWYLIIRSLVESFHV